MVYGEMPSNPSLSVFDIPAVAKLAHAAGVPLIVDSTVATPALMRPLGLGADIVVHSVSKSIASSGLAIAGALIARHGLTSRFGTDDMRADFAMHVKLLPMRDHGPAISPFNALMALTDLRTLRTKMDAWSRSSLRIAEFLDAHPAVTRVLYPGLPTPGDLAQASVTATRTVSRRIAAATCSRSRSATISRRPPRLRQLDLIVVAPPISDASRASPPFQRFRPISSRARPDAPSRASRPT